jgi:hypothetical protein
MNGEDGYFRTGRFKKASNSNFCINHSNKVERTLKRLLHERTQTEPGNPIFVDPLMEAAAYKEAMAIELARDPRAKAAGDIRMGEIVLMVDSDTRVVSYCSFQSGRFLIACQPEDCLIYGAAEMFMNPEVAILQHCTSVVQVSGDFFENGKFYLCLT